MTQTAHTPTPCVACNQRNTRTGLVCNPCRDGADRDLDAWPNLIALLPAAILPNLAQPIDRGARSRETPLPGGDALNLVAPCSTEVRLRFVPQVRIVTDEQAVPVDGQQIKVVVRRRETVHDHHGRPILIPDGDQHGDINPHILMDRWCEQLAAARGRSEVGFGDWWLRERLPWAYDNWEGVGPILASLRGIVSSMRRILDVQPYRIRYHGACPDPKCNRVALFRLIDPLMDPDDHRMAYVNCAHCGRLWELDDERITGQQRKAA